MRTSRQPPPLTAAFDRGPAKYFHGRRQILRDFKELIVRAAQAKSGTTFLIQGAPGAGKTALLHECEKLAREGKWKIARIYPPALWYPEELQPCLDPKKSFQIEAGSAQVRIPSIAQAGISMSRPFQTIKTLLQKEKKPLLLILDEAQTLGEKDEIPPDQIHIVRSILNAIHNGELDKPVILLTGGLGTTADAFRKLGISRFSRRCLVELGVLSKEAEQDVLRDWLTKDGKAKGDPAVWIGAISRETHGWPQHILSYVKPALDQLRADKRVMTAEGLNAVLEEGRAGRSEYYEHRAHGFGEEYRVSFAKLFAKIPLGGSIIGSKIRSFLTQEYGPDEAEKLFHRALHKGVLHEQAGRYAVPIPSMHDWLVSNYAHD